LAGPPVWVLEKAKQALVDALKAFPDNKDAQTAFTTAAKALKLE
jgi:hypothetical protein